MKVFIIAGEASGDKLGTAMIQGLRTLVPDGVEFAGIGGAGMVGQGLSSLFPIDQIGIMGIGEIINKYSALKRRIHQTVEAILEFQPDVLITIDLPEFNLRVAQKVKARSAIRTVHYVAPTVWAWRPKRAAKMATFIDQVLALFPFEPPFMQAAGMRCDFVGHPVVIEPKATVPQVGDFRRAKGLEGAPVLLVLPGSRRSEVSRLLPVFGHCVTLLVTHNPNMRVLVPTVPAVAEHVCQAVAHWPGEPIVQVAEDHDHATQLAEKRTAFAAADVALAASGTVSLELAAAGTPMVVAYDMAWLSRLIIGRLLRTDTVTLVNLVSETRAVPEFIGAACKPPAIVVAIQEVWARPEVQASAMQDTMLKLGLGGKDPGMRAAQAVLDGLNLKPAA
ncbi:MAG: lipid-A-disaccharide synthase [Rhodobacterales bacterium]|jgi:lipid-A-disaccharide synthase